MKRSLTLSITTKVSTLAAALVAAWSAPALAQTCPQTSTDVTHGAPELEQFAIANGGGVVYDTVAADLQLQKAAGSVSGEITVTVAEQPAVGCSADFDKDGWDDFVGATSDGTQVGFWRNDTEDNYDPMTADWSNPLFTLVPKFTFTGWFETNPVLNGLGGSAVGCGDFNGDLNPDFFLIEEDGAAGNTPYRADMFLGHGDGTFDPAYPITADLTQFDGLRRDSTPYVVDYNSDGALDFLFASKKAGLSLGTVRVFLNGLGPSPTFAPGAILQDDIPVGDYGATAVTYVDFNRDGERDLAVGGIAFRGVLLYYGISGGGFDPPLTVTDADWPAGANTGAQVLFGGDFDLDGYNDLLVGTNQGGGHVFVWQDTGAPDYISNHDADLELVHPSFTDTDLGFPIDYDNDPAQTPDFALLENSSGVFMFANRLYSQYVSCAEIPSGILDLGALSTAQMVITAARIEPSSLLPVGTTITWSASNEDPPNWQPANPCIDDPTHFCVSFAQPTGRTVRWRAEMCTNPAHTATPQISQVTVKFDYTLANTHYRAGIVVNQGVAYVGGFEQPGDNGHFYATNAGLDKTYWDAGKKLDEMADSERRIYTTAVDGVTRVTFDASGAATPELQTTLGVATEAEALDVVTWQRGERFGPGLSNKLGSILTSTPAVLGPPQRPYYYNQVAPSEKSLIDAFVTSNSDRPLLILFGSKDGALHAVQNDLTTILPNDSSDNGKEVWAFIPHRIASGFLGDKTANKTDHYPDGSPTLADVKLGGNYRTIAIVGSGNGGKSYVALDVTDSKVSGPIPMWDYVPGGGNAGQATTKAAVVRVRIAGAERFLAVLASGLAFDNLTPPYAKGLDVEAIDIATGTRAWRFRTACPITTDVIGFETDDDLEPGSPAIDGFVDRVVFADVCGNVYKVDPAQELAGNGADEGWIEGIGPVTTGVLDPASQPVRALFSVAASTLGEERPIAGTIGTRPDETGRLGLFFGTGGIENFDVQKQNAFFSVYADTGEIRDQLNGLCSGPGGACEKFYGGVVVTPEQVLITRAVDPPIATSSCDNGSAEIVALDVQDFDQQFVTLSTSAMVSSLYGDQGALYATTLSGEMIRVGTPTQPDATPDPPTSTPATGAETAPVKRRSWREILY
jgi:hypothetical protein